MADLLGGIKRWGGNLLEMAEAYGGHQYRPSALPIPEELAGPEMTKALQEQYDRQFRVARDQAIRSGAGFFGMDDYGHVGAQGRYMASMNDAITQAQTLRQQRMDDDRRKAVMDLVARRAGLDPEDPEYLDPMNAELFRGLETDVAAEALLRQQMPEAGGLAGVLQYKNGDDGYIWAFPKDGGPPVNTGVKWDTSTAAMRTTDWQMSNPNYLLFEQQKAHAKEYGQKEGEALAEAQRSAPVAYQSTTSAIDRLEAIRDRLAAMPTGRIEGPLRTWYDEEMQAIEAELNDIALRNIANLSDAGVRLNPITESELALLMSVSANVNNLSDANLKIIDQTLARLRKQREQTYEFLRFIDNPQSKILEWRPRSYIERVDDEGGDTDQGVDPAPPGSVYLPAED